MSAAEIIAKRQAMRVQVKEMDSRMQQSGLKDRWFERADEGVYAVAAEANGELFEQLARAAAFIDDGAVPLLREGGCLIRGLLLHARYRLDGPGASMAGILKASGLGKAISPDKPRSTSILKAVCRESNRRLIKELREADRGARLLEIARADAKKCRMTEPRLLTVS